MSQLQICIRPYRWFEIPAHQTLTIVTTFRLTVLHNVVGSLSLLENFIIVVTPRPKSLTPIVPFLSSRSHVIKNFDRSWSDIGGVGYLVVVVTENMWILFGDELILASLTGNHTEYKVITILSI